MTQPEIRDILRRVSNRKRFAERSGLPLRTLHRLAKDEEGYKATAGTLRLVAAALRRFRPKLRPE